MHTSLPDNLVVDNYLTTQIKTVFPAKSSVIKYCIAKFFKTGDIVTADKLFNVASFYDKSCEKKDIYMLQASPLRCA